MMNRQQTVVAYATAATTACILSAVYLLYVRSKAEKKRFLQSKNDQSSNSDEITSASAHPEQNRETKTKQKEKQKHVQVSNVRFAQQTDDCPKTKCDSSVTSSSFATSTKTCSHSKNSSCKPPNFAWIVLWDMENIPVPRAVTGTHFVQSLRHTLSHYHSGPPAPIIRINAITNIHKTPSPLRYELQANGVIISHVETKGRKEAADKALITELCLVTREYKPPFGIALISGDGDFSHAVSRVSGLGYFIVIIAPTNRRCFSGVLSRVPDDVIPLQVVLDKYEQSHSYADIVSRDLAAVNAVHLTSSKEPLAYPPKNAKAAIRSKSEQGIKNHSHAKPSNAGSASSKDVQTQSTSEGFKKQHVAGPATSGPARKLKTETLKKHTRSAPMSPLMPVMTSNISQNDLNVVPLNRNSKIPSNESHHKVQFVDDVGLSRKRQSQKAARKAQRKQLRDSMRGAANITSISSTSKAAPSKSNSNAAPSQNQKTTSINGVGLSRQGQNQKAIKRALRTQQKELCSTGRHFEKKSETKESQDSLRKRLPDLQAMNTTLSRTAPQPDERETVGGRPMNARIHAVELFRPGDSTVRFTSRSQFYARFGYAIIYVLLAFVVVKTASLVLDLIVSRM